MNCQTAHVGRGFEHQEDAVDGHANLAERFR